MGYKSEEFYKDGIVYKYRKMVKACGEDVDEEKERFWEDYGFEMLPTAVRVDRYEKVQAASGLCYPEETQQALKNAKTLFELDMIMRKARENL